MHHPTDRLLHELLHRRFSLPSLYPYQDLVVHSILEQNGLYGPERQQDAHRSQLVILPTGGGKSVCFMLPALLVDGITIVVYPLLSLMNDQGRRIRQLGERPEFLRGGQTDRERETVWSRLARKESRIVLTNPETLALEPVITHLRTFDIALFVIDEAHTVTQWGESFRPAYARLSAVLRQLDPRQVVAFTATASPRIIDRITALLFAGTQPHIVTGNPDRPNIHYAALPSLCTIHDLEMLLLHRCKRPALIFCHTRATCEQIAWELAFRQESFAIRYYHAGLDKREREATERWFFHSQDAILVSTSAYGMGIDKRDIRTVIHEQPPSDIESFLQESGRAGRDGKKAHSIVLTSITGKQTPEPGEPGTPAASLYEAFRQTACCRREALLALMGFTSDACDGCDVCDDAVFRVADGEREIVHLIRHYPLRFTIQSCAHLLCGSRPAFPCPSADREHPSYGLLGNWELDDMTHAIGRLIARGTLHSLFGRLHCRTFQR